MLNTNELTKNWFIQSSEKIIATGEKISVMDFKMKGWYEVTVPSTVMNGLVANNIYPDPFKYVNLKNIPGFKENVYQNFDNVPKPIGSPFISSWWYRKEIKIDIIDRTKNYWILFKGINFSANIWINGNLVANKNEIAGAYRQFDLNITRFINSGVNILVLEIFSPNPENLSLSFVDWNPIPPDDNMGIWHPVLFYQTGDVKLSNTFVKTELDISNLTIAKLTIHTKLSNLSSNSIKVIIKATIEGIIIEKEVFLQSNEKIYYSLDYNEFNQLIIKNPRIWWPYQLGKPDLYQLHICIIINDIILDEQSIQFGIRDIKSYLYKDRSRVFTINGVDILIRGVGWTPDMMLRVSKHRDDREIALIKNANINTNDWKGNLHLIIFGRNVTKKVF